MLQGFDPEKGLGTLEKAASEFRLSSQRLIFLLSWGSKRLQVDVGASDAGEASPLTAFFASSTASP